MSGFEVRTGEFLKGLREAGTTKQLRYLTGPMGATVTIGGGGDVQKELDMHELVQGGLNIEPVITHRLPCEDFKQGFEVTNSEDCGKVVLLWETEA